MSDTIPTWEDLQIRSLTLRIEHLDWKFQEERAQHRRRRRAFRLRILAIPTSEEIREAMEHIREFRITGQKSAAVVRLLVAAEIILLQDRAMQRALKQFEAEGGWEAEG